MHGICGLNAGLGDTVHLFHVSLFVGLCFLSVVFSVAHFTNSGTKGILSQRCVVLGLTVAPKGFPCFKATSHCKAVAPSFSPTLSQQVEQAPCV